MYFLIEYDRQRGRLVKLVAFEVADRQIAEHDRLQLELELTKQGVHHEVVILEALSEAALRRTHRRYFETLSELATTVSNPKSR